MKAPAASDAGRCEGATDGAACTGRAEKACDVTDLFGQCQPFHVLPDQWVGQGREYVIRDAGVRMGPGFRPSVMPDLADSCWALAWRAPNPRPVENSEIWNAVTRVAEALLAKRRLSASALPRWTRSSGQSPCSKTRPCAAKFFCCDKSVSPRRQCVRPHEPALWTTRSRSHGS